MDALVVHVCDESPDTLAHLARLEVRPGARVKMVLRSAAHNMMDIDLGSTTASLTSRLASDVEVVVGDASGLASDIQAELACVR